MGIPTWAAGQVLTASDVNSWFVPLAVYKSADESVTSSTVLQNDDVLLVSVAASASYRFECFINYEGGTQGSSDIKWGWTFPSGLTMRYGADYLSTGGTVQVGAIKIQTDTPTAGSTGAGNLRYIRMHGSVLVSSTAGTLQFQWSQSTSSGTATIVHASSYLMLDRLA